MPADERAPTPSSHWTLHNLPIVIGWVRDDRPAVLAGPPSPSDPWADADVDMGVVHVIATEVAHQIDDRGGEGSTLRRLADTAGAHRWQWCPAATARHDGSHHALGIVVHGLPRAAAVELARGAGQAVALELTAERLRILDLVEGRITTVRRHHHPRTLMPPWLTGESELLSVWRGRHRTALDPTGAGPELAAPPRRPRTMPPGQAATDQVRCEPR